MAAVLILITSVGCAFLVLRGRLLVQRRLLIWRSRLLLPFLLCFVLWAMMKSAAPCTLSFR